ncbi:hypothetical protein CL689_06520 [Candidatus Saccharibacteria bacterium]|nr:hypothetical protein [Candidatus Saccharibacteria bacterium]MBJ58921.1 hypothetical protein [Candidatus Saccharibacteria bacterium]MBQ69696.1 hypothetical protein [Candidatus Saccharibacteria bacterium]|tara:strand:+ start:493 stop:798 length:306 start_codon:yes stop_codon:yes gene_type:complete
MTTYLILNLLFLLTAILFLPVQFRKPPTAFWIALGVVFVLTMIFDPIIIALDIVAYDQTKLLGIFIFGAPVEDFFYAMYAAIIVPLLWTRFGKRRQREDNQ